MARGEPPSGAAQGRHGGRRAGPRRPAPLPWTRLLLLALGATLVLIAWGYLVTAAVDFGRAARGGESQGWWFLAVATLGAVACLFTALVLLARMVRAVTRRQPRPERSPDTPPGGSRRGGRRQSARGTRSS